MKRNLSTITNTNHDLLLPTSPPPSSPPPTTPKRDGLSSTSITSYMSQPVHRTVASASNLANLLPTGTVLAFQTFTPSFSNKGTCLLSNTYLTATLIASCSIICFLSSFTDSFVDSKGRLFYGIATFKGIFVLNNDEETSNSTNDEENLEDNSTKDLSKYRICFIDFVHAFASLLVFLVFAFCDINVQNCFFPHGGPNLDVMVINLPIVAGLFSSVLFLLFPTTRRGFGYADVPTKCN